jgi:hypothetical protein
MLAKDLIKLLQSCDLENKEVIIEFNDWQSMFSDGSSSAPIERVTETKWGISLKPE